MILNFFFFFLLFQKNGSVGRWETKHFMGVALTWRFAGWDSFGMLQLMAQYFLAPQIEMAKEQECF